MDRAQLQQLAELRVQDADVLLAAGQWAAAYYLLGYCIECGLKACVAKQFRADEVPDRKFVNSFYTHRLEDLLAISGVKSQLATQSSMDPNFEVNWNTVLGWNETSRYELVITEAVARGMREAIMNSTSGILPWLKTQW